jgi:thiol-disulfide isomerase/thioredoxin
MKLILFLIVLLLAVVICKKNRMLTSPVSRFGNMLKSKLTKTTSQSESSDKDSKIDNIDQDITYIVYADWCGYCKKLKDVFRQATREAKGKIVMVNSDEHPDFVKKMGINGFPTIIKGSGEKHNGDRTMSGILDFATRDSTD